MPYRRTPEIQARLNAQRATIVSAAGALLAEHGYQACSVAAVAARAGVASGTVYRYFDGKADLLGELFKTVAGRELDAVRVAVEATVGACARTAAVIETFAGRALQAPRLAYVLLAEPVDPVLEQLRLEFRTAFRDVIAEIVADGVASAELPPQNAVIVAAALVGAIGEALVAPLATGAADSEAVAGLTEFATRALGVADAAHA